MLVVAVASLMGCQRAESREVPQKTVTVGQDQKPSTHTYSPFVVEVASASELPFDRMSFKDVGMSLGEEAQAFAYESLAESVSEALRMSVAAEALMSSVQYSEAITDPANHRACGSRHIYVDVWGNAKKWGYSLWSGCGEQDQFAWQELPRPEDDDMLSAVQPLATEIARSIGKAVETGCFQKAC